MEFADDQLVLAVVEGTRSMHLIHLQAHSTWEKSLKERKQKHESASEVCGVLTNLNRDSISESSYIDVKGKIKALQEENIFLLIQNGIWDLGVVLVEFKYSGQSILSFFESVESLQVFWEVVEN